MKTLTGLLLSAAFLAMNATSAGAADQVITKSSVVKYADLDLASDAGAQTLYQRLTRAASKLCEDASDRFPMTEYRSCVQRAVADAVTKIDRPTLYAVHQSRAPHPVG